MSERHFQKGDGKGGTVYHHEEAWMTPMQYSDHAPPPYQQPAHSYSSAPPPMRTSYSGQAPPSSYGAAPSYGNAPPNHDPWSAHHNYHAGGGVSGQTANYHQGDQTYNIFVEATPVVEPHFAKGPSGSFVLEVPAIRVKLSTNCTPDMPHTPGLVPHKPYEEFDVFLPEVHHVMIDARTGQPTNGAPMMCHAHKHGGVMELPTHVAYKAQLKTDSPYGSLILEDVQISGQHRQKIAEYCLNYRLQVDGHLSVNNGAGHCGSNLLEVDLDFRFSYWLGPPGAEGQGPPAPPAPQGYGGPPQGPPQGPPGGKGCPGGWGGPPPSGGWGGKGY